MHAIVGVDGDDKAILGGEEIRFRDELERMGRRSGEDHCILILRGVKEFENISSCLGNIEAGVSRAVR
jgi:hypothetical protein